MEVSRSATNASEIPKYGNQTVYYYFGINLITWRIRNDHNNEKQTQRPIY